MLTEKEGLVLRARYAAFQGLPSSGRPRCWALCSHSTPRPATTRWTKLKYPTMSDASRSGRSVTLWVRSARGILGWFVGCGRAFGAVQKGDSGVVDRLGGVLLVGEYRASRTGSARVWRFVGVYPSVATRVVCRNHCARKRAGFARQRAFIKHQCSAESKVRLVCIAAGCEERTAMIWATALRPRFAGRFLAVCPWFLAGQFSGGSA